MRAYLVGSGIASLAAAAYLIRDGGLLPGNITIFEADDNIGGAMGMSGDAGAGYVLPTGRIFEERGFPCTREFFSLVPSVSDPQRSIWDEIVEFNHRFGYYDKVHILDRNGPVPLSPPFGLSARDRLDLIKLALTPEAALNGKRISDCFGENFFGTDFWFLWAPMMGCLPQHSAIEMRRCVHRYLHLLPDLPTMTKIWRTRFNQYEAIVAPIVNWLRLQGVNFMTGTTVTSVEFEPELERITANSVELTRNGESRTVEVSPQDVVLVTNGSQTADLSIGSMSEPATTQCSGRSWALWRRLAQGRPNFGHPEVFFGEEHVPDTKWMTFTVTTRDPTFFRLYTDLTTSEPGRGGLLTLKDSPWFVTVAIFHQPEFIDQPSDVMVWWGYALYPDRAGRHVQKPMWECSGAEILEETLKHLRFDSHLDTILPASHCIPCRVPYADSICLPRKRTDRPRVVPDDSTNFGFIGQYTEVPKDVVFVMEYSIRSAREAVAILRDTGRPPPPVYQGQHDTHVVYEALKGLV
jgi:oleate hydratase